MRPVIGKHKGLYFPEDALTIDVHSGKKISYRDFIDKRVAEESRINQSSIKLCDLYLKKEDENNSVEVIVNFLTNSEGKSNGLKKLLEKIDRLLVFDADDYDEEFLPPSKFSVMRMKILITGVSHRIDIVDFAPKFISNGLGGCEAIWKRGEKLLHLVSPAHDKKKPYFFYKEGHNSNVSKEITIESVIERIQWVKN